MAHSPPNIPENRLENEVSSGGRPSRLVRAWILGLLAATYTCAFIDRIIVAIVGPAIIADMRLSDFQFGILGGAAFAVFFAAFSVPIARLADRRGRVAIIATAAAVWSAATMACGAATSYWQLLVCRVGVGIGEAGGTPPAQALISDSYPPPERASAMSIYAIGVPAGVLIGALASGWFATRFGWRMAFVLAGAPGLILALLVRLSIREPRQSGNNRAAADRRTDDVPGLAAACRQIVRSPTFRHIAIGCTLTTTAANGIGLFAPTYLVRAFGLSLAGVGVLYGTSMGVAGIVGVLAGGFAADLGGRRDARWYTRVPAISVAAACPLYLLAFRASEIAPTVALIAVSGASMSLYFAPTIALAHNLVSSRMRALASALILLAMNVFGQGLGPALMGAMSDRFAARAFTAGAYASVCRTGVHSADAVAGACRAAAVLGLRQSITWTCALFLWGACHYALAGRSARTDLARAAAAATDSATAA